MLGFLVSLLIRDQSYLHVRNFSGTFLNLVEFFDHALISGDEPKLCLLKKADGLDMDEIEKIGSFGRKLFEENLSRKRIRARALAVWVFENGTDEDTVRRILSIKACRKGTVFNPVVIDGRTKKVYYDFFRVPLEFSGLLNFFSNTLKTTAPEEIEAREKEILSVEELKTLGRLESFRKVFFDQKPYITWLLILINLTLWILMEINKNPENNSLILIQYGAKVAPLIWMGQLWRLITPAFLHVSFLHFFSNCVIIFFIGPMLEAFLGKWRLLLVYLASGLFGNLLSLIYSPYLSAGASSAVFGMLGSLITFGFVHRKEIPGNFYKVISLYLMPFMIYNLAIGFWYPNLDNYAHMGGIIGGILTTLILGVEYPAGFSKKTCWFPVALWLLCFTILSYFAFKPYNDGYRIYSYVLGSIEATENNDISAIAHMNRSLDMDPSFDKASDALGRLYSNIGSKYFNKKDYYNAMQFFRKSVELLEIKPEYYEVLSLLYERIGYCCDQEYDNTGAIRNFKRAKIFNPESKRLDKKIAEQYEVLSRKKLLEGNYQTAEDLARESLAHEPDRLDSRMLLGRIFYLQARFPESVEEWKTAMETDPGNDTAQVRIQRSIFKNLWYNSRPVFEPDGIKPEARRMNVEGEMILKTTGNYREALKKFASARDLDDSYGVPWNNMARIEILLNNRDLAYELSQEALKRDPGYWEAWAVKAQAGIMKNEYEKALEDLDRAIGIREDYGEAYRLKGLAYERMGDLNNAEKFMVKALELYPEQALWHVQLAELYQKKGDPDNFWREINKGIVYAESQNRLDLEIVIRSQLGRNPGGASAP